MTITAAVKKILSPVLEEKGFRYTRSDSCCWDYVREIEVGEGEDFEIVEQDVMVQKSNFGKKMYLNFRVQGSQLSYRPHFNYQDEEEMLKIIKKFLESIQRDDYDILKKMDAQSIPRIPKSQRPSGRQYERLYNEHADLMRKFLEREKIHASFKDCKPFIDISMEEGAGIIKRVIEENRHVSFKASEELVLELSTFYGYLFQKATHSSWRLSSVRNEPYCSVGSDNPLPVIHYCWYSADFEKDSKTLLRRIKK